MRAVALLTTCIPFLVAACGSGKPAEAIAPSAPTGAEALGEKNEPVACGSLVKPVSPLVVDWKSGDRADLEVAMKQGVAVIAYDCNGIRLLDECKLAGGYDFAGVTPKQDTIQIASKDELWANLPLSVGKLETEVAGASSIDLAILLVGKRTTPRGEAARMELTGKCEGATHYVRAAHIGAFAMARGEKGKVRAAAELFGVGAKAASESDKRVENRDGDVNSCKSASAAAAAPPDQCGATIRLLLEPIVAQRNPEESATKAKEGANPCPEGWALAEGKCTKSEGEGCDATHLDACAKECEAGNATSCPRAAFATKDPSERDALLKRGCDGGNPHACFELGSMQMRKDAKAGFALTEKACAFGDGWICWNVGNWLLRGTPNIPKDETKAALLIERGCSLGYAPSCASYAGLFINGVGVKTDVERGLSMYRKLCDNGHPQYCHQLGSLYATDRKALSDIRLPTSAAVKLDVAKGVAAWEQGCALGGLWSCTLAGRHYLRGDGVRKDPTRAKELFERACGEKSKNWDGCLELARMYENGIGVSKDVAQAVDYYERACPREGCGRAAELLWSGKGVPKNEDRARSIYESNCATGRWGTSEQEMCLAWGKILEATSRDKAVDFYADHCGRTGKDMVGGKRISASQTVGGHMELVESCKRLGKLDPAAQKKTFDEACSSRGLLCKEAGKK
ncbi:MAG: tetratricopeptide repeat protein [Polyangiaceae bacterium]